MPTSTNLSRYSLIDDAPSAPDRDWFRPNLSRNELKAFVKRDDAMAAKHFLIWVSVLMLTGALAYLSWGSWWAIPAFIAYGVVYNSADSKWHDLSHGTPFRTHRVNEILYVVVSFMTLREPVRWRWSHARHHTHTIILGLDPEIASPRPPRLGRLLAGFFYLFGGIGELRSIFRIAGGRVTREARIFVPQTEWPKMIRMSRWFVAYFAAIVIACLVVGSILPAMFVGLPRFYGSFLHYAQAFTQHAGLAEDTPDHRQSGRTVLMNPVFAFLYTNMNYHVEHHMFPMVPFYRLPALHVRLAADCPPPYRGLAAAWREIIVTLLRQRYEPGHYARRPLPIGEQTA
jgi:fatty acid desaturase